VLVRPSDGSTDLSWAIALCVWLRTVPTGHLASSLLKTPPAPRSYAAAGKHLIDLSLGSSRMLVEPGQVARPWRRLMDLMTIGTFAERTRLSPKALRLYDRLGLLPPARTDPLSGYRFYSEDQVAGARGGAGPRAAARRRSGRSAGRAG